jgi:iron complex outermembrane receptor protein
MNHSTERSRTIRALLTVGAAAFTTQSMAQSAAPDTGQDGGGVQLEEVVVTAQKRTELLSKVPVAVSAVSQSTLDDLGIRSTRDLVSSVPNLQTSVNGYTTQFSIRGIGNFSGSYSTVAVQIDGIYEPTIGALGNGLYDVGRIEVLRGPQGTVYGRNATAGVVNIYTGDPTQDLEAFGDVSFGSYSNVAVRGVVNVPVNDRLQLRASVVREKNDGFYPRGAAQDDYAQTDYLTAQITALAKLTDDITWRLAISHAQNDGTVNYLQGINYLYYPNANLATGVLGSPVVMPARRNLFAQESEPDNAIDTRQTSVRSRLTWALSDTLTATWLGGFSTFTNDGVSQATGPFSSRQRDFDTSSTTQELDLNYETDRLKSVLGLYYYRDYSNGDGLLHIGNTVPAPLASLVPRPINSPTGNEPGAYGLIDILQNTRNNENTSKAAFAQATYSVTDRLRVTGGLRYTKDSSAIDQSSQVCAWQSATSPNDAMACGIPFGPPSTTAQSTQSHDTSWKATVDYDLTPTQLLYFTTGTGYRGGGVSGNTALPPQFLTYQPETVTNYELGWKSELLNRALGLSLSAFNMQYEDMQVSAIEHDLNGNPTPVTINAAKARIRGTEAELDWRATSVDRVRGYITWLDTEFATFPNGVNASTNPDGLYNSTITALNASTGTNYAILQTNLPTNFAGNEIPNAPGLTFRVSYGHTFNLGSAGTIQPMLQVYWQDDTYSDIANTEQSKRGSYAKTDLIVTYHDPSERVTVEAFGYNLADKEALQSANAKWDQTVGYFIPPRTFGVRFGYRFR